MSSIIVFLHVAHLCCSKEIYHAQGSLWVYVYTKLHFLYSHIQLIDLHDITAKYVHALSLISISTCAKLLTHAFMMTSSSVSERAVLCSMAPVGYTHTSAHSRKHCTSMQQNSVSSNLSTWACVHLRNLLHQALCTAQGNFKICFALHMQPVKKIRAW